MNRINKRIIAIFLAIGLLIPAGVFGVFPVMAEDRAEISEREILDLKAFGILNGDENGNLNLDQEITRAEFAKAVTVLLSLGDTAAAIQSGMIYQDVTSDDWAYGYIVTLSGIGIINGESDGHFYPERSISYDETAKMLVCALGFAEEAIKQGGYPQGYLAIAAKLGLLQGVSTAYADAMHRDSAMRMIYNCLDAQRLVDMSFTGNDVRIADQTLREVLMGSEREGLVEFRGVVTANYDSWLVAEIPEMERNWVEIDRILFDAGETDAAAYLGQEVDIYAYGTKNDARYTIKEIVPTRNNQITEAEIDDVANIQDWQIKYDDTGKNRDGLTKKIASDAVVLYNGRKIAFDGTLDLSAYQGEIKMISNQGTGAVNVLLINSYETVEIENVNTEDALLYFDAKKLFRGQKKIDLSDSDQVHFEILDENGGQIPIEDLSSGDLISIFASEDGTLLKIYRCTDTVSGRVTEITHDPKEIRIDDLVYALENGVDTDGLAGETVTAKLNFAGKIAQIEPGDETGNYGAVVGVTMAGTFSEDIRVRMAVPGLIADDVEKNTASDDPEQKETPAISAKNKELADLPLSASVRYNNFRYKSRAELYQRIQADIQPYHYIVVEYRINKNGEIIWMNLLEELGGGEESRVYNAYEKTFGKSKYAFGLHEQTLGICIPEQRPELPEPSSMDYLAKVKMNNGQPYSTRAFKMNKDTKCPEVVVFTQPMNYETSGNITSNSDIGMVTDRITALDDAGDPVDSVSILTENGEKTYPISDSTLAEVNFKDLQRGDLIRYSLDGSKLDGYRLLQRMDPLPNSTWTDAKGENEVFIGTIADVTYDVVSPNLNKWATKITMKTEDGREWDYFAQQKNPAPVFILRASNNSITLGESADLLANNIQAVIYSTDSVVKAIVLVQ